MTRRAVLVELLASVAAKAQAPAEPLTEARQLLKARQGARARGVLRRLLETSPDLAEAHYLLAVAIVPKLIDVCGGSGRGVQGVERQLALCEDPRYPSLLAELWRSLETALRLDPSLAPSLLEERSFAISVVRGQLRFFQLTGLSNDAAARALLTDKRWSANDFEGMLPLWLRFRQEGTVDDFEGNRFAWTLTDADESGATVRITKRAGRAVLGKGGTALGEWRLTGGTLRPRREPTFYEYYTTGESLE